ncbi:Thaumatin-like protein 12 [Mycena indigotica]|uniref:Thaumatin-like protein 12 n=1 Tax=Mycena indigotica TaxID=2126181 RepID=A0A8H6S4C4_9AGAR|nr:Thaumatin-like protein 12 [Mycena indigotica]KAF7292103.1 Thaumatin-like protein 12 [Mycena indigotica]
MYSVKALLVALAFVATTVVAETPNLKRQAGSHPFTFVNKCGSTVNPVIADTRCGYSPRCGDAASFSGQQPGQIGAGQRKTVNIDARWVGRIFNKRGQCGPKGESCTLGEFNLDTGDQWTPQAYDISNIQGFTDSIQISANGCDTVTCTNANCGCRNAYPIGDTSGCGNDSPVRGCGAGAVPFTITFCP